MQVTRIGVERVWNDGALDTFEVVREVATFEIDASEVLVLEDAPHPAPIVDAEAEPASFDLLDLLEQGAVEGVEGPAAAAPTEPPPRDKLMEWLETVMEDHGDDDPDFIKEIRQSIDGVKPEEEADVEEATLSPAEEEEEEDDGRKRDVAAMLSWEAFLSHHRVEDRDEGPKRFVIGRPFGGELLGVVAPMRKNDPQSLKGMRRRHKKCDCILQPRDLVNPNTLVRDLVAWLAEADVSSEAQHELSSINLRVKYGHMPRGGEK